MNENSRINILTSLIWKLMERGGAQGIQFVVQIILARLLSPSSFGTIAIVMVFVSVAQVFVQSGFNTALIQKKDSDQVDFSSVFYLSLFVAFILYLIIYFTSPIISRFYNDENLILLLRVLGLILFFGALNSVQNAYVAKNMLFKKLFISSFSATLFSGFFGIVAAYMNFGVWALVIQQLIYYMLISLILWFTIKWRPILVFSIERTKKLFGFGWKLLVSSLLHVIDLNIRTLIIGRTYNSSMLGFYNRGEQFPKVIVTNIDGSIQAVMLPTLSEVQDNIVKVKVLVRRAIVTSSFVIFPLMFGMAVIASPLVRVILTDKWIESVPFIQIFCLSYAIVPVHTANLQAINALGRSDIFLRLELIKKSIGVIILIFSIPFGIYTLASGMVINAIISSFINAYPNKKLLNYSYTEQLYDIFPILIISLLMSVFVFLISFLEIATVPLLTIQIITGIFIYLGLAVIFKIESLTYLYQSIKSIIYNKRYTRKKSK